MKIFLTGGSGFLGTILTEALIDAGHSVTILTRSLQGRHVERAAGKEWLVGDPAGGGDWQSRLPDHDAVINLAGASIFTRWTPGMRRRIRESRILTTRRILEAVQGGAGRAGLLLNASAVGYYGSQGDDAITEQGPPGQGFLSDVAQAWEEEAVRAERHGLRVVLCRLGVILGSGGGAMRPLLATFRRGAGVRLGRGNQWMSWIHARDAAGAFLFLIDHPELSGPVNVTAPEPVTNRMLTRELLAVLHRRPLLPPVPGWMLRLFLGEFADTLLDGQRVLPQQLLTHGYVFQYPCLTKALIQLTERSD